MIRRVYWDVTSQTTDYRGYDLHVIRNGKTTGQVTRSLMLESNVLGVGTKSLFQYMTGAGPLDPDVLIPTISITPSLGGSSVVKSGANYSVYNTTFNSTNCTVIANNYSGGGINTHKINFNFHVRIYFSLASSTIPITKFFRVYIHDDITRAWLTPSILTVQNNVNAINRFSIYAQFSDGSVGDISCHPGFSWSGGGPGVSFVNDGRINANGASVNPTPTQVNAILAGSAAINNKASNLTITPGSIILSNNWSNPLPRVEAVGKNPHPRDHKNALNILFVSDGFESGYKSLFQGYAASAVRYMRQSKVAEPWGLLSKTSINYWRTFIPSRQTGASCLNEIIPFSRFLEETLSVNTLATDYSFLNNEYTFNLSPATHPNRFRKVAMGMDDYVDSFDLYLRALSICPIYEYNVDKSQNPIVPILKDLRKLNRGTAIVPVTPQVLTDPLTVASTPLLLSGLIAKVGLPTEADVAPGVTLTLLLQKWKELYDNAITLEGVGSVVNPIVAKDVYDFWIEMRHRRLLNERDNAMGMATGSKPDMPDVLGQISATRSIGVHPFRNSRPALDALFDNLIRDDSSAAIDAWRVAPPAPVISSVPFIGFLTAGTRRSGTMRGGYMAVGVGEESTSDFVNGITAPELELNPFTYPVAVPGITHLPEMTQGVITHEFAHLLRLGDEYGNFLSDISDDWTAVQNTFNQLNLMLDINTRNSSGDIEGDQLRWRWLRIRAAGIIMSPITINNSSPIDYRFDMQPDHASHFPVGQKNLYLRKRLLARSDPAFNLDPRQYGPAIEIVSKTTQASGLIRIVFKVMPTTSGTPPLYYVGGSVFPAQTTPPTTPPTYLQAVFDQFDLLVRPLPSRYPGIGKVRTTSAGGFTLIGDNTRFRAQLLGVMNGNRYAVRINNISYPVNTVGSNILLGTSSALPLISTPTDYDIVPVNDWQELLHDSVRIAMNNSNNPMTTILSGPTDSTNAGSFIQLPNANQILWPGGERLFDNIHLPVNAYRVVGLYNGIAEYNSGGYHPTGWCAMRRNGQIIAEGEPNLIKNDGAPGTLGKPNGTPDYARGFCPICRYIMVDTIDPSCHTENDIDYDQIYPKLK